MDKKIIEEKKAYMQYVATKYVEMLLSQGWSLALESHRVDGILHQRLEPVVMADPNGILRSVGWFEYEVDYQILGQKRETAYSVFMSALTIDQQRHLLYDREVEKIEKVVEFFAYYAMHQPAYFEGEKTLKAHMELRKERYERRLPVSTIYEKPVRTSLPGFKSATLRHQIRSHYDWRKQRQDLSGYYVLVNKNGREMLVGSYEYKKLRKKVA